MIGHNIEKTIEFKLVNTDFFFSLFIKNDVKSKITNGVRGI